MKEENNFKERVLDQKNFATTKLKDFQKCIVTGKKAWHQKKFMETQSI